MGPAEGSRVDQSGFLLSLFHLGERKVRDVVGEQLLTFRSPRPLLRAGSCTRSTGDRDSRCPDAYLRATLRRDVFFT